jgi:dolichol-phosphate mannosyltransferase
MRPSITIIVPAMNEEENLEPTVETVLAVVKPRFDDYEVLIVEDGSRDRTAEIADQMAARDPRIVVYHNPENLGLGYSLRKGVELASKQYVGWVAGNNLTPRRGLEDTLDAVGQADIVSAYVACDVRGFFRRFVSRTLVRTMNLLFGLRLKYYTGPCVYRSADIKTVRVTARGSLALAEILIRLVKSGRTYVEVGLTTIRRTRGQTKTFRPRHLLQLGPTIARLFWEIRVLGWLKRENHFREPERQAGSRAPDGKDQAVNP